MQTLLAYEWEVSEDAEAGNLPDQVKDLRGKLCADVGKAVVAEGVCLAAFWEYHSYQFRIWTAGYGTLVNPFW